MTGLGLWLALTGRPVHVHVTRLSVWTRAPERYDPLLPASVRGVGDKKAVSGIGCGVADLAKASIDIASTIVRGSGSPPAPGAG